MMLTQAADPATITEICRGLIHWLAIAIGLIGVGVIVLGVFRGVAALVVTEFQGRAESRRTQLRIDLGFYLLLGLEFLIAADIIETLLAPDLEHLAVLGTIVLIRTVITVSLNWELNHHKVRHEAT